MKPAALVPAPQWALQSLPTSLLLACGGIRECERGCGCVPFRRFDAVVNVVNTDVVDVQPPNKACTEDV
jgi:hypothetical protein